MNTLLIQLASDVEADSPYGYDPVAKAAFHCLCLYETSTALHMGNAAMVLNIPQGIHVSRRTNSTREAAEWRAMYPMPSITPAAERNPGSSVISSHMTLPPAIRISIPTCGLRQGVPGNGASNGTTTQRDPLPSGHHETSHQLRPLVLHLI